MSFIDFIEDNKDFLECIDILDLLDIQKLQEVENIKDEDILQVINKFNKKAYIDKIIELIKIPICVDTEQFKEMIAFKEPFDNSIVFAINRTLKYIIINTSFIKNTLYILGLSYKINPDIECILKNEIKGYKIYSKSRLGYDFNNLIKETTRYILNIYSEEVYKKGKFLSTKNDIEVEQHIKNKILMDIKKEYCGLDIHKDDLKYKLVLYDKDSIFKTYDRDYLYFFNMYLQNKDELINLIKLICLKHIKQDINNRYIENDFIDFYLKNLKLELNLLMVNELNNDNELNKIKNVIHCLQDAGKSVTVNGLKVKNNLCNTYNIYDAIIGDYNAGIKIKDIKIIKFGKKTLFNN